MTKTTLTNHQRTVLQAAASSAKLTVWPLPRKLGLSKASATIVIKGLIKKGLVEERPALGDDPVWREDKDGKGLTVVISKAGLTAIGMAPDDVRRRGSAANPDAADPATPATQPRMPRAGSKLAMLVEMLSREGGATTAEMVAATAWQGHTIRGVMSATLGKRFELQIVSDVIEERGRVYWVKGHRSG